MKASPVFLLRIFGQAGHKRTIPLSAAIGLQRIKGDGCMRGSGLLCPFGQGELEADDYGV